MIFMIQLLFRYKIKQLYYKIYEIYNPAKLFIYMLAKLWQDKEHFEIFFYGSIPGSIVIILGLHM